MSQRMTKDLIAQIVSNVLRATNLDAEQEQIVADTKKRVHEVLIRKVPEEFLRLALSHPREWFEWQGQVYIADDTSNPLAIMRIAVEGAPGHRGAHLPVEPAIPVPAHNKVSLKASEELAGLIKRANSWASRRSEVTRELRAFLQSCTTVKQAVERMPEIEKHIPAAAMKTEYPLVAPNNVLSALTKLGFDTTTKA